MKKTILLLVIFIQAMCSHANVFNDEIILPDNYKIKGSFSGELSGNKSFHIVVAQDKGKKNYELFVYKYTDSEILFLNTATYDNQPTVLSFHSSNDVLTLIVSFQKKRKDYYNIVDFNLETKNVSISEDTLNENTLVTFRDKEVTILLNGDKKELIATKIINSKIFTKITADKDQYNIVLFNKYFNATVDAINQNEYVKNGSVKNRKAYYKDDILTFTKDKSTKENEGKSHDTSLFYFDLNKAASNINEVVIKGSNLPNISEYNSYLLDDKLVQITSNGKNGFLLIHDKEGRKVLNNIDLLKLDFTKVTKGENFESIEKFLKETKKKKYLTTITLNKTKDLNYFLRVDYVENTYSYNSNWWWWHHQMFMMQQQQMMMHNNVPTGFGPGLNDDYEHYFAYEEGEDFSFQLSFDINGKLVDQSSDNTIYEIIDKKNYVDELNDDKTLKHSSSCFVEGIFRYMGYNKKEGTLKIFNKNLQ